MAGKFDREKLTPEQQEIYDEAFGLAKADLETVRGENQKNLDKLKELEKSKTISEQERADLKNRIKETEDKLLTEKEKAEREVNATKAASEEKLKKLEAQSALHKKKYIDTLVETKLTQAAASKDVFSPSQIVKMLRGDIHIEEVKEGDEVVDYQIKLKGMTSDGKPIITDLETGVTNFLKDNTNLLKSSIIRSNDKKMEGIIVTGGDGKPRTIDREQLKDAKTVNENAAQIVDGLSGNK